MPSEDRYTLEELLTVTIAHDLKDGERGFTGMATGGRTGVLIVGVPIAAMELARRTHAPSLSIFYTGVIVNPVVPEIKSLYESGPSLATIRCEARQKMTDIFSMVRRREMSFGFSSAAQIDQYGNVNTSVIGDFNRPELRLLGSVLLPEHFTLFGREYVLIDHNPRKFVPRVDFISGPGHIDGGPDARARAGLRHGGPRWVLTELGVFDFDEATGRMRVRSIHPGYTLAEIQERTGFELIVPPEIPETTPPTDEEIRLLRTEIDPHGVLTGRNA
ncbi:MAG TPA: CoA-transferase [Dehalococcoidia bacterium]|nr:CoA-transferase [Dehalococcoidia bacterium]